MVKRETDVLVVGAGPVGLFTALRLVERGLDVQVIDKDWRGAAHSYALALHPLSLRLLDECGVADSLLEQGYKVERVAFYRGEERVGALDLTSLEGPYPFVLVIPQSALERALRERLEERKVKVLWNHQALKLEQNEQGVTAKIGRMEKYSMGYPIAHTEWMVAKEYETQAEFVVGADGYHSFVRKGLGADFDDVGPAECFSVYECVSSLDFRNEVRVSFHEESTNVVWPLSQERGRWSFQVDEERPAPPTVDAVRELIRTRAPWFRSRIDEISWHTTVRFERRLTQKFGDNRIWLVGDAGHITGPVGAQSMNVGLREAGDLAQCYFSVRQGGVASDLLRGYAEERRAEWSLLLGLDDELQTKAETPGWASSMAARILPCVPASGDDLRRLLDQVGLALP
jgi:2-polyprenyl-6-methoxyphenol hydroxylase-like FAD-dependent oxidoreductase